MHVVNATNEQGTSSNTDSQVKVKDNIETKKNTDCKCFYINARSIVNKLDEFELYIDEEKPDIIGITETWLTSDIENSELDTDDYTVFRRDRQHSNKTRGGGVLLLVKNSLVAVPREDIFSTSFPESVWCNIGSGKDKLLVGVCYRPPDSSVADDEALFSLVTRVSKERTLIIGDFNFPDIHWIDETKLDESNKFVKCINDNFLHQKVHDATRGENVLDLILVTDESMIREVNVGEPFGTSDHNIVRFELISSAETEETNLRKTYDYFKADYDLIREELSEI